MTATGAPRAAPERRWRSDRGSITAEFVVAMPAVALVLAACVGGVAVASQSVRLQDAAAAAAREAGRGGGAGVASRLAPGSHATQWGEGELVCVRLSAIAAVGPLAIPISASSCALGGGQ